MSTLTPYRQEKKSIATNLLVITLSFIFVFSAFFFHWPILSNAEAAQQSSQQKKISQPENDFSNLQSEFQSVEKDSKKSTRRDIWLNLEDKFETLAKKNSGDLAARAWFYHARCREELGKNSYLISDFREAATRYAKISEKYPKNSVAASSLFLQARILHLKIKDLESSARVLELLIKKYPKSPDINAAKQLLANIKPADPAVDLPANNSTPPVLGVTLNKIGYDGNSKKTKIVFELSAAAKCDVEYSPADSDKKIPARLYIDFRDVTAGDGLKPLLLPSKMAISRIRTGNAGNSLRVMIDCDGIKSYTVAAGKKNPKRITIEVSLDSVLKGGTQVTTHEKSNTSSSESDIDETSQDGTGKKKKGSILDQLGLTVQTIMIDAGHGGKDPGAMAAGITEKIFTLAMAKRVGSLLQKRGFTVLYTRTSNKFISLQDRPDMANHKRADLFISIHINANPKATVRGLETYYLDVAKTADAATVAARENAVSVKQISDLQVILSDLMLSSKLEESHDLAVTLHNSILKKVASGKFEVHSNGVRSAPFYVLMGTRMPAVLVEFGYITNPEDIKYLTSEKYLQLQAEGLVQGIVDYRDKLARSVIR